MNLQSFANNGRRFFKSLVIRNKMGLVVIDVICINVATSLALQLRYGIHWGSLVEQAYIKSIIPYSIVFIYFIFVDCIRVYGSMRVLLN